MPVSGPALPAAMRASAARAAARAPSRSTVTKALICPSRASMRARLSVASSTAETVFARRAAAMSLRLESIMGVGDDERYGARAGPAGFGARLTR
jgi:hypothetical protein